MIVAVGSYWHDNKKGNVRVFKFDGTEWKKMGQDLDEKMEIGMVYGSNSDGMIDTGAWFHDNNKGQARVLNLTVLYETIRTRFR